MSTQTALNQSPPPSSCFGNSFASNNLNGRRDHPKLKLKPSFSFLNNIKRAVGAVDPSLSFSFNNNNSISLPFGTVLRNNGLDPLPHCYPLPLQPGQSSPLSLNYPSSLPPRLERAVHFIPPTTDIPLSSSSPDLFSGHNSSHPIRDYSLPQKSQRPREEDTNPQLPKTQGTAQQDSLLPSDSRGKVPADAPTLNLRPVSVPFAAGFSEQFLLSDLHSDRHELQNLIDKRKKQREGPDHKDHCSCCSTLASENAELKNRVKELELHIYRSHGSKPRRDDE